VKRPNPRSFEFSFPDFTPRPPWWGGDLQTLRNFFGNQRVDLSGFAPRRLELPMNDGSSDRLAALLNAPKANSAKPLVIMIHGLGGCETSRYMLASAAHFLSLGHPTLRLNLRGAGPSRPLCEGQYHAGRSADLCAALSALAADEPELTRDGVFLLAYSLGANMMLKFLGEKDFPVSILGAASVSAPIDLAQTAQRLKARRNRVYNRALLAYLKRDATGNGAKLTESESRAVEEAHDIYQFDELFIAPHNGFSGANDYYQKVSALNFLAEIETPTLVIHAKNDPWIPSAAYKNYDWEANAHLHLLLSKGGGHAGFHAKGGLVPWHDRATAAFFDQISPAKGDDGSA
jgi:uncharacterized protein